MGYLLSKPKLTQEEALIESEKFLWGTKIELRNSFKLVEEYFWNDDKQLTNSKCTTINLNKDGDNFFTIHVEDKARYLQLIDIYYCLINITINKVREKRLHGFNEVANRLQQNKP